MGDSPSIPTEKKESKISRGYYEFYGTTIDDAVLKKVVLYRKSDNIPIHLPIKDNNLSENLKRVFQQKMSE